MPIQNSKFYVEIRNIDSNLTTGFLADIQDGADNPQTLVAKLIRGFQEILRQDPLYTQAEAEYVVEPIPELSEPENL